MNRLQKKCFFATVGAHLLLVVILIVGPAFFYSRPKPDDSHVLTVIPATAVEAVFESGVKHAQPPPPAPIVRREETPLPPTPKPVINPPPQPKHKPEPVKMRGNLQPDDLKPTEKPEPKPKPTKREIKVNLNLVNRTSEQNNAEARRAVREERHQRERQAQAFRNAVQSLKKNFTTATVVDMPGASSVSYANYASIVKSKYDAAWSPDNVASDEANVKVKVTIASDGTVVSAHIINPSGDAGVDDSVQRALDRVTFIAPFPDGATEKEKTFIINFNLKAKRMLG